MSPGGGTDRWTAKRAEVSALKTFVDPAQVAAAVAFLCSEDAAMMTGQDLNVSAGADVLRARAAPGVGGSGLDWP